MACKGLRYWLLLLAIPFFCLEVSAQKGIMQAEYFWDADPGEGNATAISAPASGWDTWLNTFIINDPNRPVNGTHLFNIRMKDGKGAWGPVFKKVVDLIPGSKPFNVSAAEYFIDNDPGPGNAIAMAAFDGNFNSAIETALAANPAWPVSLGDHFLGIRVRDEAGQWGIVFKKVFSVRNDLRDIKITSAEFFWDDDPGQGNAVPLLAFDNDFNSNIESVINSNPPLPSAQQAHIFNLRIRDEAGVWGPLFKKVIGIGLSARDIRITAGEIFWDTDPGEGNGTPLVAYDGAFDGAVETILRSSPAGLPTSGGAHLFNIRFKDESGNWGPVYKKSISLQQALRNLNFTQAEYFWNTDPGPGNAQPIFAIDGNFDDALEVVFSNSPSFSLSTGDQKFSIRIKDESGNWGPVFSKVMRIGGAIRDIQITLAEYFWGVSDPGPGNGYSIVAIDGDFNSAIEEIIGRSINVPPPGTNVFNIRVSDEVGQWGPLYQRAVEIGNPLSLYITSQDEIKTICFGDSLLLKAHGGNNYSWLPIGSIIHNLGDRIWVKPTSNTVYKLIGTRNGVPDSATFEVIVRPTPVLQVNNPTIQLGSVATMNVVGADTYLWTPDVIFNIATGASVSVAPSQTTTFFITGINATNGCRGFTQAIVTIGSPPPTINPPAGLQNMLAGEFFWDSDPGMGNGIPIDPADGSWNSWLEELLANTPNLPADEGFHALFIRVKDREGNWGGTYRKVIKTSTQALRQLKITQAEFFWNTDPGEGLGRPILAFDGNFNSAIEEAILTDTNFTNLPPSVGIHSFNIRIRDESGLWGPVYRKALIQGAPLRNMKIINGEYFWDNDPGEGFGIAMIAMDGNLNSALEDITTYTPLLPSDPGAHIFNVRVKDEAGLWGHTYKKPVFVIQQSRNMKVTYAEYFWDNDPGEGSGTPLLAFDGNFNSAIEAIWRDSSTIPGSVGKHNFNIRIRDEKNQWGPVFRKIVMVGYETRPFKITGAEYFWDNDPGEGLATTMIAFDGNFNDAFESVLLSSFPVPSPNEFHTFNIRMKDEEGFWGPLFKKVIKTGDSLRDIKLTAAEYFFGLNDPGPGNANPVVAYDGNFDNTIETIFSNSVLADSTGIQLFNIRVKDDQGNWGPLFKKAIIIGIPLPRISIIARGPLSFCPGDSVLLTTSFDTSYSYQWYKNGSALQGKTDTFFYAKSEGIYHVIKTKNGISAASNTLVVSFKPVPVNTITPSGPTSFCTGGSVVLNAFSNPRYSYQWLFNNSSISSANGSSYQAITAGNYSVFINYDGCSVVSDTIKVQIGTPGPSLIVATGSTTFCSGYSVVLSANTGTGLSYKWLKDGVEIPGAVGATYNATSTGNYQALVFNFGCPTASNTISVLTQGSIRTSTTTVTLCQNQFPYSWNGQSYLAAGSYSAVFASGSSICDSVAYLNIIAKPVYNFNYSAVICSPQAPYFWNGGYYYNTGIYSRQFVSIGGCDSILTLNLVVNSSLSSNTSVSVCNNQLPYIWNGISCNSAGTYSKQFYTAQGCDSTAILNLTINPSAGSTRNVIICSNQLPYIWNGISCTSAGTYSKNLLNTAGCDSLAVLNLSVKQTSSSVSEVSLCEGQLPYSWNGRTYTLSGTYRKLLVNSVGCDSTATLVLTVKTNSSSTSDLSICSTQLPYFWNGIQCPSAGTYSQIIDAINGCDSVLTLNLSVYSPVNAGSISGSINQCVGLSNMLTTNGSVGGSWSSTNSSIISINSVTGLLTGISQGSAVVKYIVNSPACGSDTATKAIIVDVCSTVVSIKAFLQGYYASNNAMKPALLNSGIAGAIATQSDTISVELRSSVNGSLAAGPVKTILNTDGTASATFPAQNGNYYIVIRHRNSLETWSAAPVAISGSVNYDFTTAASMAYGNNMANMGGGKFAFWSGDINQDGAIESTDYSEMENDVMNVLFGYHSTDLTGDGVVESEDYALMENNVLQVIFVARPF